MLWQSHFKTYNCACVLVHTGAHNHTYVDSPTCSYMNSVGAYVYPMVRKYVCVPNVCAYCIRFNFRGVRLCVHMCATGLLPCLSSGKTVTVKDLQEEAAKPSYSQESAHDFLKNHFFGVRLERAPGTCMYSVNLCNVHLSCQSVYCKCITFIYLYFSPSLYCYANYCMRFMHVL